MKVIVVGLGVQGTKRRAVAKEEFVAAVDPVNPEAQYRRVQDVPADGYDAALVCTPDQPKVELLEYLLSRGKHVLVEKPLWAPRDEDIERLGQIARERKAVCYTAYNHRFEPHYLRMRDVVASGILGVFAATTTLVVLSYFVEVFVAKLVSILVGFAANFSMSHFVVFRPKVPIDGREA